MPSLRSNASSAPRSPVASAASAAFSRRSFSDAANQRRLHKSDGRLDRVDERAIEPIAIRARFGAHEDPRRDVEREGFHERVDARGGLCSQSLDALSDDPVHLLDVAIEVGACERLLQDAPVVAVLVTVHREDGPWKHVIEESLPAEAIGIRPVLVAQAGLEAVCAQKREHSESPENVNPDEVSVIVANLLECSNVASPGAERAAEKGSEGAFGANRASFNAAKLADSGDSFNRSST